MSLKNSKTKQKSMFRIKYLRDSLAWKYLRMSIEFFHEKTIQPKTLIDVYGDKIMDLSTVRRRALRFSSSDGDVKYKPRFKCL